MACIRGISVKEPPPQLPPAEIVSDSSCRGPAAEQTCEWTMVGIRKWTLVTL